MMNHIGLYYPFIHFKDDSWVKLTALYWDRMGRIVPRGYLVRDRDSDTVKRLAEDGGFVQDVSPGFTSYDSNLHDTFIQLLQEHAPDMRARYGVAQRYEWPDDPRPGLATPSSADPKLAYVYVEKMPSELKDAFIDTGLAVADWLPTEEGRVGMHPDLAFVYMTALAEEIAARSRYHPVTDETRDHLAVTGCTLERLARVLLQDEHLAGQGLTEHEIEAQMATLAFASVLPRGIINVPTEKIIAFRKHCAPERAAFQDHLQGMVSGLQGIQDQDALETHLHVTYERQLKPQLDEYRRGLHSLGIDTVMGAFNVRAIFPPLVTSGMDAAGIAMPADPVVAAGGAIAFSVLPVLRAKQKEARDLESSSPVAYLMRVEERLGPTTLTGWVARRARQFFLRV